MAAEEKGYVRSAVSRNYYAAFQAATAILHYVSLVPPDGEQGWSHQSTPDMIEEHLKVFISSRNIRHRLKEQLRDLYKLRVRADYRADLSIENTDVQEAKRTVGFIMAQIEAILPKGN